MKSQLLVYFAESSEEAPEKSCQGARQKADDMRTGRRVSIFIIPKAQAGEFDGASNVREAIEVLGTKRFTLSTDDPFSFGNTVEDEHAALSARLNFTN